MSRSDDGDRLGCTARCAPSTSRPATRNDRCGAHRRHPMKSAVLLINLGTPDAPTAPAVRRYLKEFLSDPRVVEIPRRRVVADPERHHPADPVEPLGRQVPHGLDGRRLAVEGLDREAGEAVARPDRDARSRVRGRLRDALRQPVDRERARPPAGAGLRPHPRAAAVSAVLRDDHRLDVRRRRAVGGEGQGRAGVPLRQGLPRRRGLREGARGPRSSRRGCATARPPTPTRRW